MTFTTREPATLDQVAGALAHIARTANTEITWSDHGSDMALRQIASEAHTALSQLGYGLPRSGDTPGPRSAADQ